MPQGPCQRGAKRQCRDTSDPPNMCQKHAISSGTTIMRTCPPTPSVSGPSSSLPWQALARATKRPFCEARPSHGRQSVLNLLQNLRELGEPKSLPLLLLAKRALLLIL